MPGTSVTAANALLTSLTATYPWVQLHTADPGAGGSSSVAGNATRKLASWAAPSGGSIANGAELTWTSDEVDTAEDYTHYSLWSAENGGTFGHSGTVTADAVEPEYGFALEIGALVIAVNVAV